ncbi:hypothetical protein [Rhodobacter ferrooxidans]|uniref:Uncharacterized protein n=1 Tax=Rhodobacter ferrooxidans TaxID=371731 RepID=C8S443_9RHOB|nr:hypothetical protein [Rhodobacter sp. SW2]EEW24209.1 conserved hypothetical protein [Rhodobacter sp. SW2]
MANPPAARQVFNIVAVAQAGRLQYEAVLLAASLRAADPDFPGKLFLAEPQPGKLWPQDPRVTGPARELLESLGAVFLPFDSRAFGQNYPYGNKIECLSALPDAPFLFLDTDTLITGSFADIRFDFARPSASMRREGTWPTIELYGPGYDRIWGALYARFGLDFASSLDEGQPAEYWQRYLYFNAGWFFHQSPQAFGARFLDYATQIKSNPPPELVCQPLDPWLDQVALPLVIHSLGGGRPGPDLAGLDGDITCHWRTLPLLYARESDAVVAALEAVAAPNPVKRVLKDYDPFKKLIYQGKGTTARALFDRENLPRREQFIRNTLKREGLWFR